MSRSFGDSQGQSYGDRNYGGSNRGGYGGGGSRGGYGSGKPYGGNGFYNKNKFLPDQKQDNDQGQGHQSQGNYNKGYDSDDNHLGENLHDVDYGALKLPPFQKVFYQVGKALHSEEEISNYRKEKDVIIRSKHADIPQPFINWSETKFPKYIMSVIEDSRFAEPMPIQAQAFPIVLSGHDLIGIAQTGSGKTLAFMLPALVHINAQDPVKSGEGPIVLVLAPTRELANQIQEQCYKFGSRCKISSVCVYGGAPRFNQERELRRGCDVVIATPGRLIDFLESKVIDLRRVTYLVLDEADRMLDMGFEPSIRKIVGQIRPDRQTLMFSATWPQSVRKLALDFCHSNPIHIQIGDMENNVNNDIEQICEVIPKNQKYNRLKEILTQMQRYEKTIVFTQTKQDCDDLSEALSCEGIRNACIHGDKSQRERDKVMDLFKTGRITTLIATDVASRGLDVKDIKIVVNFDFPKQIEDYVHRVGRTGRAGATGKAISFLDKYEDKRIARELVDVLKQNNQDISEDLLDLAEGYRGSNSNTIQRRFGNGGGGKFSGNHNNNNNNNRYSNGGDDQGFNRNFNNNNNYNNNNQGGYRTGGSYNNQGSSNSNGNSNSGSYSYNRDFPRRDGPPQQQQQPQQNHQTDNGDQYRQDGPKSKGFFNAKKESNY